MISQNAKLFQTLQPQSPNSRRRYSCDPPQTQRCELTCPKDTRLRCEPRQSLARASCSKYSPAVKAGWQSRTRCGCQRTKGHFSPYGAAKASCTGCVPHKDTCQADAWLSPYPQGYLSNLHKFVCPTRFCPIPGAGTLPSSC
jgi:hypothetical protein